jgi:amidase
MNNVVDRAAQSLREAGADVRHLDLPPVLHEADRAHRTIMAEGIARSFTGLWETKRAQLSPSITQFIEMGLAASANELAEAWHVRARALQELAELFEPGEILISPSAASEAPHGLENTGNAALSRLWTLLHTAAMSVPIGTAKSGMPLGVQFVDPVPSGDHLFPAIAFVVNALDVPRVATVRNASA